VMLIL